MGTTEMSRAVRFVDLPGCGTKRWPRHSYVKDVDLDSMDALLIVTSGRFTECDASIYTSFVEDGSRSIMVVLNLKNRIEEDPDDGTKLSPEAVQENMYKAKMETVKDMAQHLDDGVYLDTNIVFAVDARFSKRDEFEMPRLKAYLVTQLAVIQRAKLRKLVEMEFKDKETRAWNVVYTTSAINAVLSGLTSQIGHVSHIPVTVLQMHMVYHIASIYQVAMQLSGALAFVLAEAAKLTGIHMATTFIGLVPGWGNAIKGSVSGGLTYALGRTAITMAVVDPKTLSQTELADPVWQRILEDFSTQIDCMNKEVLVALEAGTGYGNVASRIMACFGRTEL
eukprot:NODE_1588_length_1105_cov_557.117143.p1 GENE.NODE_1588_length_1105_cov_557.117143~~NODE_1588_length_1105_cov_557.117143.p1  ORF type:complete len:337 (-),score=80.86 NODE_1588_length_1105_cov_557.117143:77-1087(-)